MLIVLGGFRGSGRKFLARRLAAIHGMFFCGLENWKGRTYKRTPHGQVRERVRNPSTDEMRSHLYNRALSDFPLLAKMHGDIVIEDSFHRMEPRSSFLQNALKYFKPVIFVWIEADEAVVLQHLEKMKEKKLIGSIRDSLERRKRAQDEFDGIPEGTLVYKSEGIDDENVERLWKLIEETAGV